MGDNEDRFGDDSYRRATQVAVPDDNLTAVGNVKSYRKTPYHSRIAGINYGEDHEEIEYMVNGPRDEHRLPLQELLSQMVTDVATGLTAPQVRAHLEMNGPNTIAQSLKVPEWVRFSKCLFGGCSLFLWGGALLSFVDYSIMCGTMARPSTEPLVLGVALVIVNLLTGIFSFIKESAAASLSRDIERLVPNNARVIRECIESVEPAEELVVGDILILQTGDVVPADCRILEATEGFMVDNSKITGESEPIELDATATHEKQLFSRNMAFFSACVVRGKAKAVVTRTGIHTVMGQMADLTAANPKDETLITTEISNFVHISTLIGVGMGLFCFVVAFLLGYYWIDAILFFIGVIVANVPESLLVVFTISLSVSATRLSKRNCVVKNLEAVETIGSTSIILCDKTGTLTSNQPSVAHVWVDNVIGEVDTAAENNPEVTFDAKSATWKNMARAAVLCSRSEFTSGGDSEGTMKRECTGTPIEAALLRFVEGVEGHTGTFRSHFPKICEIPFSPIIKFQLSIHECADFQTNGYLLAMFGEPETVLNRCSTRLIQGQERDIEDDYRDAFRYACTEIGSLGERLIAVADWRLPPRRFPPGFQFSAQNVNFPLSGFRLLGIVSLFDPPRPTVPDSIAKCQAAGIKIIMMTGDHPATAKAIAKSVGILGHDQDPVERTALLKPAESCLITGEELADMTAEQLDSALIHHQEIVLAGFAAEQKLNVVTACQRLGAIVAVTGDGVNDAAALRKADVGIAMGGPTSTDVAKQAADIILLDDNFSSIVIAIEEGRIMFDNLKKSLYYMLCSNAAEIAPFIFFLVAQVPLPLGTLAVLCIDLGTDILPAISLAFEEEEKRHEVMKRGPRNPISEGLLDERVLFLSYGQNGLISAAAGFFTYFVIMAENGFWPSRLLFLRQFWDSRAVNDLRDSYDQEWTYEDRKSLEYSCQAGFFISIVMVQWANLFLSRTRSASIISKGFGNMMINFALVFETLLALLLIYIPGLNNGLQLEMLHPLALLPALPFVLFMVLYDEIRKAIIRKHPNGWMQRELAF